MLSLIIPAHNEEQFLPATLAAARIAADSLAVPYEIIVVSDASTDRTAEIAVAHGARVLPVSLRQIGLVRNAGAVAARFPFLCFLDADTLLPRGTLQAALAALRQGSVAGGALVEFDEHISLGSRVGLQLWNTLSRTFRLAAGSFIFVRAQTFHAVGGFDSRYFAAEEIFLSSRLKRQGPFTILPHPVITSARKMHSHSASAHFLVLFKVILTFGKTLQRRDSLGIWYETKRGSEQP